MSVEHNPAVPGSDAVWEETPEPSTPPPALSDENTVEATLAAEVEEIDAIFEEAAAATNDPAPVEDVPMEDIVPDPERDEIERLLADTSHTLKLSTGSSVRIRPLKMREFLRLLRIISRGGAGVMGSIDFDFSSTEEFVQSLLALVLFAVPEAENETVDFIQSMCEPETLSGNVKDDMHARELLVEELDNPELIDLTNILAVVVRTEGRDLQALGKRLRTMFEVARKMGVVSSGPAKA